SIFITDRFVIQCARSLVLLAKLSKRKHFPLNNGGAKGIGSRRTTVPWYCRTAHIEKACLREKRSFASLVSSVSILCLCVYLWEHLALNRPSVELGGINRRCFCPNARIVFLDFRPQAA